MKRLLLVLMLIPLTISASKYGRVKVWDGTNPVNVTIDSALTISDNSNGLAIAQGKVTGTSFIHKFGEAPDFDASDGIVTIWGGADDAAINAMDYVYSTTAEINKFSSDNNNDSMLIEIQGLNADTVVILDTITLQGQVTVTSDSSFYRVFRMKNINSSDNAGHIYCYAENGTTGGTPNSTDSVRAVIQPGDNQTLMTLYTIPANKTGYMRSWFAATSGGSKSSNYIIEVRARPKGGVFQLKHKASLADAGTSHIQHKYVEPEVFAGGTDIELRVSATNGTVTACAVSGGFDIVLIDD